MRKFLPSLNDLATAILVLCAVTVTTLLLHREFAGSANPRPEPQPVVVGAWRSFAGVGHRVGPERAPATIVVFSDFQCPFCRTLAARLDTVQSRYPGRVAVVYRHFPLRGHPFAGNAAQASECAAEQGQFKAMHDRLFMQPDSIGRLPWEVFATRAGVRDLTVFGQCMRDARASRRIAVDQADGERLGVTGTPTFLINQTRLQGAVSLELIDEYVRAAIERSSRS